MLTPLDWEQATMKGEIIPLFRKDGLIVVVAEDSVLLGSKKKPLNIKDITMVRNQFFGIGEKCVVDVPDKFKNEIRIRRENAEDR